MVSGFLAETRAYLDELTGVSGTFGYIIILSVVFLGHQWMNSHTPPTVMVEEDKEVDPPRNFTKKQLAYFDGKKDEKTQEDKPVYLSLNGIVFDVSEGRGFYGPDGPYELFAGHECGVALAKMSFETKYLDDLVGCKELKAGEKMELENWIEKFTYYRQYPVKGKLVDDAVLEALKNRTLTKQDLEKCKGLTTGEQELPEGYATQPIYLGAGGKVYDVSFGGVMFYGPGGSYHKFAGKDASRALAKMSFDEQDLINTSVADLNDKEKKVLSDWVKTFEERKGYPIVGKMK